MAKLFPDRDEANGVKIKKEYYGSPNSLNCSAGKWQKDKKKKKKRLTYKSLMSYLNSKSLLMLLQHYIILSGTEG